MAASELDGVRPRGDSEVLMKADRQLEMDLGVAPKPPKQPSLHARMRAYWEERYAEHNKPIRYFWQPKDGAALKRLIGQITFMVRNVKGTEEVREQDIYDTYVVLIEKAAALRWRFLDDNFTLSVISSKFNEIVQKINKKNERLQETGGIDHNAGRDGDRSKLRDLIYDNT